MHLPCSWQAIDPSGLAKAYRPYFPEQDFLLPPSLHEWLAEDHLAYFVSDLIDQWDLSLIERHYELEERGYPPCHPGMMTKVLIYGYCVGVFSSRRMGKRLVEDVAFRVLAAGNEPDFRTISEFRRMHLKALEGLFAQVLRLALELGTMRLGRVAIDGTRIEAAASKHEAMSYERKLREEVKQLLIQAEHTDAEEDKRYGRSRRGNDAVPYLDFGVCQLPNRNSRGSPYGPPRRPPEQAFPLCDLVGMHVKLFSHSARVFTTRIAIAPLSCLHSATVLLLLIRPDWVRPRLPTLPAKNAGRMGHPGLIFGGQIKKDWPLLLWPIPGAVGFAAREIPHANRGVRTSDLEKDPAAIKPVDR